MDTERTEQYQCKSYYDDNNELQDCTCGKCAADNGHNRQIVFAKSGSFIESYNSKYRVTVYKPISEKKAEAIARKWLDMAGMNDVSINDLYEKENGINSNQKDRWVFGLGVPGYMRTSSIANEALDNLVDITNK